MALFRARVIIGYVVYAALVIVSNAGGPDITFEKSACNGRGIDLLSDYARARDIGLEDAVSKTPEQYYNYFGKGRYMMGMAYTNGRCFGDLSKDQCLSCLKVADRQIIASCAMNTEGWVQLKDCFISYWEFPIN